MPTNDKEYMKSYYETHKREILERMRETVLCTVCNCVVSRSHLSKHYKSKKHICSIKQDRRKQLEMQEIKDELDEIKNLLLSRKNEKVKDILSSLTEANTSDSSSNAPSESEKSEDSDSDTNNKPIKEISNTKKTQ